MTPQDIRRACGSAPPRATAGAVGRSLARVHPGEDRAWVRVHHDGESCADFSLSRDGEASGDIENGIRLADMVALRSSDRIDLLACGVGFRLDEADRAELGRFLDFAVQLRDSRPEGD